MYSNISERDSVSLPVKKEVESVASSTSMEDTILRNRGKVMTGIALVMVVALVASSTFGNTPAQLNKSPSAFVESTGDSNHIASGEVVLNGFGIMGAESKAFVTHSGNDWEILSHEGIYGADGLDAEERWDFEYFPEASGGYYKILHLHGEEHQHEEGEAAGHTEEPHFLSMQGSPNYNPTVLFNNKRKYDNAFIRWQLIRASTGQPSPKVPETGVGVSYYLVNVGRNRCLAVHAAVENPHLTSQSVFGQKRTSVTSEARDASGNFPAVCKVQLIDGSLVKA